MLTFSLIINIIYAKKENGVNRLFDEQCTNTLFKLVSQLINLKITLSSTAAY